MARLRSNGILSTLLLASAFVAPGGCEGSPGSGHGNIPATGASNELRVEYRVQQFEDSVYQDISNHFVSRSAGLPGSLQSPLRDCSVMIAWEKNPYPWVWQNREDPEFPFSIRLRQIEAEWRNIRTRPSDWYLVVGARELGDPVTGEPILGQLGIAPISILGYQPADDR